LFSTGPPPIPFPLKRLRGNPGHQRLGREPQPSIAPNVPEPPPVITGYAADECWRIAEELHRLGLLTVIDTMPLAVYCASYARWRIAEETLARIAANDPATHWPFDQEQ
jgi:phage terminase small subunit